MLLNRLHVIFTAANNSIKQYTQDCSSSNLWIKGLLLLSVDSGIYVAPLTLSLSVDFRFSCLCGLAMIFSFCASNRKRVGCGWCFLSPSSRDSSEQPASTQKRTMLFLLSWATIGLTITLSRFFFRSGLYLALCLSQRHTHCLIILFYETDKQKTSPRART